MTSRRTITRWPLRWAFSDNFYADSEVSVDGHHWLVGAYPNAWTESTLMAAYGGQKDFRLPTTAPGRLLFAGATRRCTPRSSSRPAPSGITWSGTAFPFRNFGEGFELAGVEEGPGEKPTGARYLTNVPMPDPLYRNTSREYPQFNMNIPDQYRATQFIAEIERAVREGRRAVPALHLHPPAERSHGQAAAGRTATRIRPPTWPTTTTRWAALSSIFRVPPWWKQMAIFITEDDAQGGRDHVDAHRTVLLVVSPYAKRNYVSHANSSFPGLLKTAFRLLGIPPLSLFDAAATDLRDCFGGTPDFTPYKAKPVDARLFDPAAARLPLAPHPSPRLDDPQVIREQHRR